MGGDAPGGSPLRVTVLVDPDALTGDEITVEGEAYRHLFRARRLAVGDEVRLVDGAGGARAGWVLEVDRREARLEAGAGLPSLEPAVRLTIASAPPRRERASWLVEKATELGVSAVRFVAFERAARDFGRGTRDRLLRVARAAVEQCGRAVVPEITLGHDPREIEAWSREVDRAWWLDATGDSRLHSPGALASALLVIGPEGGWEDHEREFFLEWKIPCASLGERALRIETAAVVGAGVVLGSGEERS